MSSTSDLYDAILDMKEGECITAVGINTGNKVKVIERCPYIGPGKVYIIDAQGRLHLEDILSFVQYFRLVEDCPLQEYMVSVDGTHAPRRIHPSWDSANEEAERLATKHTGNRVRVLKLERTIIGKRKVEIEECQ